jgi:hypothetical protein
LRWAKEIAEAAMSQAQYEMANFIFIL